MSKSGKKLSKTDTQAEQEASDNKPLANPLVAEIAITLAAALLRNGVVKLLERGHVVQTKEDRDLLKTSPARRIAALGARKVATRSVPGALLVGAGIMAQGLLRHRKASKTAAKLAPPVKDKVEGLEEVIAED